MLTDLDRRILGILKSSHKPLKAWEISRAICSQGVSGMTKQAVNSRLYSKAMRGLCSKDELYRWFLIAESRTPAESPPELAKKRTRWKSFDFDEFLGGSSNTRRKLEKLSEYRQRVHSQEHFRKDSNNGHTAPAGSEEPDVENSHCTHDKAEPSVEEVISQAKAQYAQGECYHAIWLLSQLIDAGVNNVEVFALRGEALAAVDNLGSAIKDFTKAIELEPGNEDRYVSRAEVYHKLGWNRRAESDLMRAIKLNPKHAYAHFLRGIMRMEQQRYEAAVQHFDTALSANSALCGALVNRAVCYFTLEDYSRAENDLTLAHSIIPYDSDVLLFRAIVYFELEENRKSLQDCNESLSLGNTSLDLKRLIRLCEVPLRKIEWQKQRRHFRKRMLTIVRRKSSES